MNFLARRITSLQVVPIKIESFPPIYVDLRAGNTYGLLIGTPWKTPPRERDEQAIMSRIVKSGDVAFDIGAHIGLHTVLVSQLVGPRGRVFAFEPNPELQKVLKTTISSLPNTTLYSIALSDQASEATLFIPADDSCASLSNWTRAKRPGTVRQVPCKRRCLDDLIQTDHLPHPNFLKCDVEGAELFVFRGARATLNRADAPIILFEADIDTAHGFELTGSEAINFLAGLEYPGYKFFKVGAGGSLTSIETINSKHSNILAVPSGRWDSFSEIFVVASDGRKRQ